MRNSRRHEVADQLHSAAIRLLRRLKKADDETGITAPRLSALSVLVFAGPLTLGQLAAAEQVRPPTMTRLVTALENDGLVVRQVVADDRRKTIIRPTAKGRRVMARGRARRVEQLAARLASMTSAELADLESAALLMRRIAAMEENR
ncbi:MAG: MarR family transcriptional regulator [Gemmatimonadaceae bacterium]|nr:MarR family transcriptional regulator [Gemmatimonadaceae bacterium]